MKVKVYSSKTCPRFHKTKEFQKKNSIKYQDINVGENQKAAQEMIKKSGQTGVPVIDIEGKIIVGFDESAIKKS